MANNSVLAIDIGGTKIGWALLNAGDSPYSPDLSVIERGEIPTNAFDGGPKVASRIVELCKERLAGIEVDGIAVASAGVIDPETGTVVFATGTMPGWRGTELGKLLSEACDVPVHIINDVHAHGLGESILGAGRGFDSVLACAVGTGMGGAHIVDSAIVFGDHNVAGHFGHMTHAAAAGQPCSCGRTGHIEAIASGSGSIAWYNSLNPDHPVQTGKDIVQRAEAGEELAGTVLYGSAFALGEVLGSLANAIDPSVVVLSGSVTNSGQGWWDNVRAGYRNSAMDIVADLELRQGECGSNAPLLGAALHFYAKEFPHE